MSTTWSCFRGIPTSSSRRPPVRAAAFSARRMEEPTGASWPTLISTWPNSARSSSIQMSPMPRSCTLPSAAARQTSSEARVSTSPPTVARPGPTLAPLRFPVSSVISSNSRKMVKRCFTPPIPPLAAFSAATTAARAGKPKVCRPTPTAMRQSTWPAAPRPRSKSTPPRSTTPAPT